MLKKQDKKTFFFSCVSWSALGGGGTKPSSLIGHKAEPSPFAVLVVVLFKKELISFWCLLSWADISRCVYWLQEDQTLCAAFAISNKRCFIFALQFL